VISRRSFFIVFLWLLAISIPTSYSKGRLFETRRIELAHGIDKRSKLDSWPVVFALTVADGEPESIRRIALAAVLLSGICIVSLAFDFAPRRRLLREQKPNNVGSESQVAVIADQDDE
jgi:hypothetical protein